MAVHTMVDLETLGPSLIISLGAVKFNGEVILDKFHVGIDPVDAERYGLKVDATTAWNYWADPKRDAARKRLFELPKVDLFAALDGFGMWIMETPVDDQGSLFGNGATFDNVKLKAAYDAAGIDYPIHYRKDECYRTLKNRFPDVKYTQIGVAHDALDDAASQALHLIEIAKAHGIVL